MAETKVCKSDEWLINHTKPCSVGSNVMNTYSRDTSTGKLVKTGEVDLEEQANAASVGCGVYGIIDRIQRGSNVDLPTPTDLQYGDMTGASEIYAADSLAAQQKLQSLQKTQNETQEKVDDTATKLEKALSEIEALKAQLSGGENK